MYSIKGEANLDSKKLISSSHEVASGENLYAGSLDGSNLAIVRLRLM